MMQHFPSWSMQLIQNLHASYTGVEAQYTRLNKLTQNNGTSCLCFPELGSLRGRIQHRTVPGQEVALASAPRSLHSLELQTDVTKCYVIYTC